jgi:hypothetical protein
MNKIKLLILAFVASANIYSQDIIHTKSGDIEAKVTEISQNEVSYKKSSNLDGPTYKVDKSSITSIDYKNGEKDIFENQSQKPQENQLENQVKERLAQNTSDDVYNQGQPTQINNYNNSNYYNSGNGANYTPGYAGYGYNYYGSMFGIFGNMWGVPMYNYPYWSYYNRYYNSNAYWNNYYRVTGYRGPIYNRGYGYGHYGYSNGFHGGYNGYHGGYGGYHGGGGGFHGGHHR